MATDSEYGNCLGPNSEYIVMISADGHEFFLNREIAIRAGTVKDMLAGPGQFPDDQRSEINFRDMMSRIVQKVCSYLIYKCKYNIGAAEIPEFQIDPEIACELVMAATFLNC